MLLFVVYLPMWLGIAAGIAVPAAAIVLSHWLLNGGQPPLREDANAAQITRLGECRRRVFVGGVVLVAVAIPSVFLWIPARMEAMRELRDVQRMRKTEAKAWLLWAACRDYADGNGGRFPKDTTELLASVNQSAPVCEASKAFVYCGAGIKMKPKRPLF